MPKRLSEWLNDTPGAGLLLLRGFLGITFTFAGLQKLANPAFFRANTPGSIQQQLLGADRTSPISGLVGIALHQPVLIGVVIAICELLVGLAALSGVLARPAAALGAILSFSFFLTVSFHSSPYYYGSDIVFVFAWTPIILSGPGALTLKALLGRLRSAPARGARAASAPATRAGAGAGAGADVDRRTAVGLVAGTAVVLGGAVAGIGRALSPKGAGASTGPTLPGGGAGNSTGTSTSTSTTGPTTGTTGTGTTGTGTTGTGTTGTGTTGTGATGTGATGSTGGGSSGGTPKGTRIGPAADVPVGAGAGFTDPSSGNPAYALQPTAGHFTAFSAVCTHAGCTVNFNKSAFTFDCPCHGSRYDASNGSVLNGPASQPLPSIPIAEGSNGQLYVDG